MCALINWLGLAFWSCAGLVDKVRVGVHAPSLGVTFDLSPTPPPLAWQRGPPVLLSQ